MSGAGAVRELMTLAPVIPVLVVDDVDTARPLAEALVAGGLPVLEVTLRTPVALEAMAAMADVPGRRRRRRHRARRGRPPPRAPTPARASRSARATPTRSGASPANSRSRSCPASRRSADIMRARDGGCTELKFFPAVQAGGVAMLKALGGPFVDTVFCPTGGITAASAPDFLALPNVLCVGGSWVAPKAMVAARDGDGITALAREAAALPRPDAQ